MYAVHCSHKRFVDGFRCIAFRLYASPSSKKSKGLLSVLHLLKYDRTSAHPRQTATDKHMNRNRLIIIPYAMNESQPMRLRSLYPMMLESPYAASASASTFVAPFPPCNTQPSPGRVAEASICISSRGCRVFYRVVLVITADAHLDFCRLNPSSHRAQRIPGICPCDSDCGVHRMLRCGMTPMSLLHVLLFVFV